MKRLTRNRIAVISESNPRLFEAAINARLDELADYKPELIIESIADNTAYLKYSFTEYVPETIADQCELLGVQYHCKDCKYCEFAKTKSGEIDRRIKKVYCAHGDRRTYKDAAACSTFYMELATKTGQFSDNELPPGANKLIEELNKAADHHADR